MRCNCGKIKGKQSNENSAYAKFVDLTGGGVELWLFADSDTSRDYISYVSNTEGDFVETHGKYISEGGEAIKEILESSVVGGFFMGTNGLPSTGAIGTYTDEARALIKAVLVDPSEESKQALVDFMGNVMATQEFVITRAREPVPAEVIIVEHGTLTPVDGEEVGITVLLTPESDTLNLSADKPVMDYNKREIIPGTRLVYLSFRETGLVTVTFSASSDPTASASLTFDIQPGR